MKQILLLFCICTLVAVVLSSFDGLNLLLELLSHAFQLSKAKLFSENPLLMVLEQTCLGGVPRPTCVASLAGHIPFRLASLLLSVSSDIFSSTLLCGLPDF